MTEPVPTPAEPDPAPVDGREGTTLLKFQFLVFTGVLALFVPGPFVLGTAPLTSFYWAAIAMHVTIAAWMFFSDRRMLPAALGAALPVSLTPWLAYGMRISMDLSPLATGAILFVALLLSGIALGRKLVS